LVTNDDGITAPGIRALIAVMNEIGEVYVVAPDSPQSGMGHAITVNNTIYCDPIVIDTDSPQKEEIMPRKPDLCVSGINHGSNAAINVIYSGTMSAAVEAGIEGIPAIGEPSKKYVRKIVKNVLKNGLPKGIVLNVNIPRLPEQEIKGLKICRQANAHWLEEFDKRVSPMGKQYYWLSGKFINEDKGEDTDEWALQQGYVSIVPTQFDLTAHHFIQELNNWPLHD